MYIINHRCEHQALIMYEQSILILQLKVSTKLNLLNRALNSLDYPVPSACFGFMGP